MASWLPSVLRHVLTAIGGASLVYHIVTAVRLFVAEPSLRVQFLPDDAFYYLTLARNFDALGLWTFDSGQSLTSGFHPLHAYVLAGIHAALRPDLESFVHAGLIYGFLVFVPSWLIGFVFSVRSKSIPVMLVFIVVAYSINVTRNTISLTEWSWVVLAAVLYCVLFDRGLRAGSGRSAALLFLCGLVGVWARSDFALLPVALGLAVVVDAWRFGHRHRIRCALAGIAGTIVGTAAWAVHNQLLTGSALQSSVKTKLYWAQFYGIKSGPVARIAAELLAPWSAWGLALALVVVTAVVGAGIRLYWTGSGMLPATDEEADAAATSSAPRLLWVASLITIVGYFGLYSRNSAATQGWYTANLIVPIFIALAFPLRWRPLPTWLTLGVSLALVTLCLGRVRENVSFLRAPPWPHQEHMREAGLYLRRNVADRVASWNAGIIGYYEGGHVVNLDGLVNSDIYEYVATNDLDSYLEARSIRYLVDFDAMLSDERRRRRGGYDGASFLRRLQVIQVFDDRQDGWRGLTLYEIAPPSR